MLPEDQRLSDCIAKDRPKWRAMGSGRAEARTLPAMEPPQFTAMPALSAIPAFIS